MTEEEIIAISNQIIDMKSLKDIEKILPNPNRITFKQDMNKLLTYLEEEKQAMVALNSEDTTEKLDIDTLEEKIKFCVDYLRTSELNQDERYSDRLIIGKTTTGRIPFNEDLKAIDYSEYKAIKKALDRIRGDFVCDGANIKELTMFDNVYRSSGNKQIRLFFRMLPNNYVYVIGLRQKKRDWGKEENEFVTSRLEIMEKPTKEVCAALKDSVTTEELLDISDDIIQNFLNNISKKRKKTITKKDSVEEEPEIKEENSQEFIIDDDWLEKYQKLKEYYDKYKTINTEIKGLVNWLKRQRCSYHLSLLNKKQIDLLNDLDIDWDYGITDDMVRRYSRKLVKDDNLKVAEKVATDENKQKPIDGEWYSNYFALIEFNQLTGKTKIDVKTVHNGLKIGYWLRKQQRDYWDCILDDSKINLLNKIGIDWTYGLSKERIQNSKRFMTENTEVKAQAEELKQNEEHNEISKSLNDISDKPSIDEKFSKENLSLKSQTEDMVISPSSNVTIDNSDKKQEETESHDKLESETISKTVVDKISPQLVQADSYSDDRVKIINDLNALMVTMPYEKLKKFEAELKASQELEESIGNVAQNMQKLSPEKLNEFILMVENDADGLATFDNKGVRRR